MSEQQIIGVLATLMVLMLIAPAALRLNRGGAWLRNLALWLAVAACIALAYRLLA